MKTIIKKTVPDSAWQLLRQSKRTSIKTTRRVAETLGYNIAKKSDYSSPLPVESQLEKNVRRWNQPSAMCGVSYEVEDYKKTLEAIMAKYWDEFQALPPYQQNKSIGFGPGYPELDALLLYMMLRDIQPKKYLEIGSGLSTYYCSLAARENARNNRPLHIQCVEPYPFAQLYSIPGIEVTQDEVQNVDKDLFLQLEEGDVLFIDSSHVLKIDGDVPFLYLEILPQLQSGVIIHIHDMPFPYNIPYPPEQWILGKEKSSPYWPMYWNEAMLLQAFLAFNPRFEIIMSTPLIRYFDEQFLRDMIPLYKSLTEEPDTFSSIWLKVVD